jgi:hypothetical protein
VLGGVARLLAPGAGVEVLVSVLPRDGASGLPGTEELVSVLPRDGASGLPGTEELVSVLRRDGAPAGPAAAELAVAYARHGLRLVEVRPATAGEVAASRSSWAKRLRAGTAARPVTFLRATRDSGGGGTPRTA